MTVIDWPEGYLELETEYCGKCFSCQVPQMRRDFNEMWNITHKEQFELPRGRG